MISLGFDLVGFSSVLNGNVPLPTGCLSYIPEPYFASLFHFAWAG